MGDLRDDFIHAMSRCAASVSVVTTDGAAGRAGLTVSAMTSVSADGGTPTMLVCVNKGASAAGPILANGCFAGTDWTTLATGAPVLAGLAGFDCTLQSSELVGTHHVLIGAVRAVRVAETGTPLIYGMRAYLRAERA